MGDITKEEYEALDLHGSLNYRKVSKMCCGNKECEKHQEVVTIDSEEGPHDFIYAKEIVNEVAVIKNMPIKWVCAVCVTRMDEISSEFFKLKEEKKFTFNVPRAQGDRSKDYYRDFSKQSWKSDPEAGQNATKMSKKDINKFNNL